MRDFLIDLLPDVTFHLIKEYRHDFLRYTYSKRKSILIAKKTQSKKQINEWWRNTSAASDININILIHDRKTDYKAKLPTIEEDEHTIREINKTKINIIIDDIIAQSPTLEDGQIKIWAEDYKSPFFIKMLLERIDFFKCK